MTRFADGGLSSRMRIFKLSDPASDRLKSGSLNLAILAGFFVFSWSALSMALVPLEKPAMADLSLPKITTQVSPDLQIHASGERIAETLAHYSAALQFEKSGKMREALTQFLAVLEVDPANPELAAHTAELAYHYQGRKEAVALLDKAIATRPDEPAAYLNLVCFLNTYISEEPFEANRAKQVLADVVKRFPKRADVCAFASLSFLSQNMRSEAIAVMDQAAKQEVKESAYWLELGRAAQEIWPLAQIEKKADHTSRVNAYFEKALSHAATGKKGETTRIEVAQYYLLTNQLDAARALCELVATQTGNLQARKILFRLYEAAEEKDKALSTLEKIVRDAPTDVEQQHLLVTAYESREMYAKAVPHLEATIQIGGGDAGDYQALGELLLRSQLYDKLIQLSERCVKLYPDNPVFHLHAALAQRSLLRWEKAIQSFERAAEQAESTQAELVNHRFFFQYGLTLERGGRHDEAAKMFEKSITLTPKEELEDAANTLNYLGYMWLDLERNLDKAGELIRKANELQPEKSAYVDSLGWWHFKKGDYPNALKELQRAFALLKNPEPDDAEIIEHIAQVYLKMDDQPKAREFFEKASALQPTDPKLLKRIEDGLKRLPKP